MHHKYLFIVLILLAIAEIQNAEFVTLAITTISVISSIVTIYLAAEQKFTPDESANGINKNIFNLTNSIENRLDKFNSELNDIEIYMKNYLLTKEYLEQYEEIHERIARIDFLYKESQKWSKYAKKNKAWDLDSKTDQMISLDADYPQSVLFDISRKFFQIRRRAKPIFLDNFYRNLLQSTNNTLCDEDSTPHYQLFLFYKLLIYTEVKGFATMAFSYMWKNQSIDSKDEMDEVKDGRIKSIIQYTDLFRNKMKIAKNFIRRCDAKYKVDENIIGNKIYASFNNMFYTTVLDMESIRLYSAIDKNELPNAFQLCRLHNNCHEHNHDYDKICPGLLSNCRETRNIDYCRRRVEDQTSAKNYYWIKFKDIDTRIMKNLGSHEKHMCQINPPYPFSQFYGMFCDCMDENIHTKSNTIRAFSLLWSQTSDNMVATGARLVAKDRMIHIQLREGKLLPYGGIDKKTERWVPLPTFEYYGNFPNVAIDSNGKRNPLNENVDFISIHHLYAKTICLQKLTFDEQHLLTGVRFSYEYLDKRLERCFELEAKFVGFNYQHGNITTKRKYKKQSCKQLPELILNNPDDPLKFDTHPHDSKENQFITIRASDLIKDASQTTIPFFDLLEIAPETSQPITAIELFHKGQLDGSSGGYVSLKIYPINLTIYMNPPLINDSLIIDNTTIPKLGINNR